MIHQLSYSCSAASAFIFTSQGKCWRGGTLWGRSRDPPPARRADPRTSLYYARCAPVPAPKLVTSPVLGPSTRVNLLRPNRRRSSSNSSINSRLLIGRSRNRPIGLEENRDECPDTCKESIAETLEPGADGADSRASNRGRYFEGKGRETDERECRALDNFLY